MITYNYVVGSHYQLMINDDHFVIHRLYSKDFWHVKFEELSDAMKNLLLKIRKTPEIVLSNFEYMLLSNVQDVFADDEHKMTML